MKTPARKYSVILSGDDAEARSAALAAAVERVKSDSAGEVDASAGAPVAVRVTVTCDRDEHVDEAFAWAAAALAKGAFDTGKKLEGGTKAVVRVERGLSFVITFSGETSDARAKALEAAAARMKREGLHELDVSSSSDGATLRLTITRATGDTCFDEAVRTAIRDVSAGAGAAGWDLSRGGGAELEVVKRA